MRTKIGGFRDGLEWPDRGGYLEVPDHEGEDLIRAGYAKEAVDEAPLEDGDEDAAPNGDGTPAEDGNAVATEDGNEDTGAASVTADGANDELLAHDAGTPATDGASSTGTVADAPAAPAKRAPVKKAAAKKAPAKKAPAKRTAS
jgi:hypothetical protein